MSVTNPTPHLARLSIITVCLLAVLLLAAMPVVTQETSSEAPCIEEHWPWIETLPASVAEMLDEVAVISRECSPATTMYAQRQANVRAAPSTKASRVGVLAWGEELEAVCGIEGDEWSGSEEWCDTGDGYVHSLLLGERKPVQRPTVAAAKPETTAVEQQPSQVDVCSGYDKCVQVCTYHERNEYWFAAAGLGASQYWKGVPNCDGPNSGSIWWDPCGGGGQFDTIWANNGLYLRWSCPG